MLESILRRSSKCLVDPHNRMLSMQNEESSESAWFKSFQKMHWCSHCWPVSEKSFQKASSMDHALPLLLRRNFSSQKGASCSLRMLSDAKSFQKGFQKAQFGSCEEFFRKAFKKLAWFMICSCGHSCQMHVKSFQKSSKRLLAHALASEELPKYHS